jgi:hypothetical protein
MGIIGDVYRDDPGTVPIAFGDDRGCRASFENQTPVTEACGATLLECGAQGSEALAAIAEERSAAFCRRSLLRPFLTDPDAAKRVPPGSNEFLCWASVLSGEAPKAG